MEYFGEGGFVEAYLHNYFTIGAGRTSTLLGMLLRLENIFYAHEPEIWMSK